MMRLMFDTTWMSTMLMTIMMATTMAITMMMMARTMVLPSPRARGPVLKPTTTTTTATAEAATVGGSGGGNGGGYGIGRGGGGNNDDGDEDADDWLQEEEEGHDGGDDEDDREDDDTDGVHVLHRCPAGARHSVGLLPRRKTVVACGRRVGPHRSSPMAEGLECFRRRTARWRPRATRPPPRSCPCIPFACCRQKL